MPAKRKTTKKRASKVLASKKTLARAQKFADTHGVHIPGLNIQPHGKPTVSHGIKAGEGTIGTRTVLPQRDARALDGRFSFAEVCEAMQAVVNAGMLRAMTMDARQTIREKNKPHAYAILRRFGAGSVRELKLTDYDAVVQACRDHLLAHPELLHQSLRQATQTLGLAAPGHRAKIREYAAPSLPFGLHYFLSAILALLSHDPALGYLSSQVRAKSTESQFHRFDQFIHEEGRRTAVILLSMAFDYLDATDGKVQLTPTARNIMSVRMHAIKKALESGGYCYKNRRHAASETRAAIDVWASIISGTL